MAHYNTNEFKAGLKILLEGLPYVILENEFVKPGKGQAFNRVRLRQLLSGKMLERTFKSGENIPKADIEEQTMQYLYKDGTAYYFMHTESFEQTMVPQSVIENIAEWLLGEELCTITLWDGKPVVVSPPTFVDLVVEQTDPGLKGDSVSGGSKPATLQTGAVVRVPLFVQPGEKIRIDTRTKSYVSRVQKED